MVRSAGCRRIDHGDAGPRTWDIWHDHGSFMLTLGKRAKLWRSDTALRGRLVSVGHLLTGNAFGTVIGMLGFLATARALGAADYGILALTYSYVRVVGLIVGFQSWQPLIKYGAELTGSEHSEDYRSLMKFGLLVDVAAALAAYIVAVGFALLFGPLIGIGEVGIKQVVIYSTVLLFDLKGLPTAVLRLAGRFRIIAYGSVVGGAVRLLLCMAGLLADMGLLYFVVVWTLSQVAGSIGVLVLALNELRRQGVRNLLSARLAGVTTRFKGLWGFTIASSAELTVRSSTNEFDTLLVGLLTDATGAGLYHVAKRIARLVLQIGVQVQAVLYPDVARLWAQRAIPAFRRTVLQTEIMLAAFGVVMVTATVLGIVPLLEWTVGPQFAAAGPLAIVQMIAVAMMLSGSVTRVALLAMGRQIAVLRMVLAGTLAFHATALTMIPWIGAMGANVAHIVMSCILLAGWAYIYHSSLAAHALKTPDEVSAGAGKLLKALDVQRDRPPVDADLPDLKTARQ